MRPLTALLPSRGLSRLARVLAGAALLGALAGVPHPAGAEEVDPELARLQAAAERARAEADRAKAEAEKAKAQREALEAALPKSGTKGLEGKLELDRVNIEAHLQTYAALRDAIEKIAASVVASGPKIVVIRNSNDISALLALKTLESQIVFLREQYERAFSDVGSEAVPVLLAPQLLGSVLGSLGDIAGFFHAETKLTGVDVTVNGSAVVSELARVLKERGVSVYYPEIAPAHFLETRPDGLKQLAAALGQLGDHYATARPTVEALKRIQELEALLASAKTKEDQERIEALLKAARENPDARKYRRGPWLVVLNASVDRLLASLNQADATGAFVMAKLAAAIDTRELLKREDTLLLEISAQKAGGNNKTSRSVFRSGKDSYSGGVVLSYAALRRDGAITLSGNVPFYRPYARPSDIRREANGTP